MGYFKYLKKYKSTYMVKSLMGRGWDSMPGHNISSTSKVKSIRVYKVKSLRWKQGGTLDQATIFQVPEKVQEYKSLRWEQVGTQGQNTSSQVPQKYKSIKVYKVGDG